MKHFYMLQLNKKLFSPRFLAVRCNSNKSKKGKKYAETLNLPKTDFTISMRNVAERELSVQKVRKVKTDAFTIVEFLEALL